MNSPDTSGVRASRAADRWGGWKPASFEEFWPFYVSQHLDPVNRWLHFAGTTAALGCLAATPVFPPALLGAPLCGYGMAWLGHFVFEKNRPATFGHPLWSLRGDFKMWSLMVRGRMGPELEAGRQWTPLESPSESAA